MVVIRVTGTRVVDGALIPRRMPRVSRDDDEATSASVPITTEEPLPIGWLIIIESQQCQEN